MCYQWYFKVFQGITMRNPKTPHDKRLEDDYTSEALMLTIQPPGFALVVFKCCLFGLVWE